MTDPFAHGTPVGDDHMWVRPANPPCPNCPCCTTALCEKANKDPLLSCGHFAASPDFDLFHCPCSEVKYDRVEAEMAQRSADEEQEQ